MGIRNEELKTLTILDMKRLLISRKLGILVSSWRTAEERKGARKEAKAEEDLVKKMICQELNLPLRTYDLMSLDEKLVLGSAEAMEWYCGHPCFG